ncbi:WG repeat-containing protein [Olleya sp. HaHaR_3_96]|uniref:WG repeat-containing protein n=1 Tax=Olleya sp. HaHaR_3_96 TaxID=2745560 RepID=UPI001C4E49C2|nr:WG repeat-containing protein [Olleya sp. HaHaR_3_96]QXP61757.1 WG repeat-containing protein [Olleya sp. HaHaR_3_96]
MPNFKKIIFPFVLVFMSIMSFSQGLNKEQRTKLKKKGYSIEKFQNGYAVIYNRERKRGIIDRNGKIILKTKYTYLSNVSDKGNMITGDFIYGGNDGGGAPKIGLKNIKIITLKGDVIKEAEFANMKIQFLKYNQNYSVASYFKLWNSDRIGGLIDCNGDYIIKPIYDYISFFNNDGKIITFLKNEMYIFNNKGIQLNKTPLKYKIELHSQSTTRFPLLKNGNTSSLQVIDENVICSKDGINYGVFNLKDDKALVPFQYEKIATKLLIKDKDTLGYKVYKNKLSALVDYKTNNEVSPFIFEEITDLIQFKNKLFLEGHTLKNKEEIWTNYLNLETKELIFPSELELYNATPINSDFWIVKTFGALPSGVSSQAYSVYNVKETQYIEPPELGKYSSIDRLSSNLLLFNKKNSESWIYDLNKKETVKSFSQKPRFSKFKLSKDGVVKNFIVITADRKNTLYDEEFNVIFKDLYYSSSYIEKDRYIIKERIDKKYVRTAYGIDGKVIGEKYKYK